MKFLAPAEQLCVKIPLIKLCEILKYISFLKFLGSKDIKQGLASYDEMCDAYLLYYVDSNEETELLEGSNFCWSAGPPEVSWHNLGLKNIPNRLASSLI